MEWVSCIPIGCWAPGPNMALTPHGSCSALNLACHPLSLLLRLLLIAVHRSPCLRRKRINWPYARHANSLQPPHNSGSVTSTIHQRQDGRSDLSVFSSGRRIRIQIALEHQMRTGRLCPARRAREPLAWQIRRCVRLNMYAEYTHKARSHQVTNTCIMDGGGGHIICMSLQCQVCIHEMRSLAAPQYLFVYADAAVTKSFLRPEQTQRALDFLLSPSRRGPFEHLAGWIRRELWTRLSAKPYFYWASLVSWPGAFS